MNMLNTLRNKLESNKNKLASLAPVFLFLYLFIGVSAYINWFPGSARFFYSSSITGVIARIVSTLVILIYSVIIFFAFNQKMKVRWLIVFFALLLVSFVSIFLTKHNYYFTYKTNLYGFLTSKEMVVGYKKLITMYLSSLSDFIVAFCFVFMLPFSLKSKKTILIIALPVVFFMLFQCGYSIIFERAKYIKMISGESDIYSGYDVSIGAMFGDKQEFGAFLTVGYACAVLSIYLLMRGKLFSKLLTVVCYISLLVFLVISLLSGCKTATLSNILISFLCLAGAMSVWLKTRRKLFFIFLIIISMISISLIVFLSVPSLHSSGIALKAYNMIYNRFLSKIFDGVDSRNFLSLAFFENADAGFIVFGITKGAVPMYMRAIILDGQSSIHTGFTYFFASYGLFGFMIYSVLLYIVIRNIIKIIPRNKVLGFTLLGLFVATLVFNFSESEILIVSSSAPIFVFNILVVSYPKSVLIFDKNNMVQKNREVICCEI